MIKYNVNNKEKYTKNIHTAISAIMEKLNGASDIEVDITYIADNTGKVLRIYGDTGLRTEKSLLATMVVNKKLDVSAMEETLNGFCKLSRAMTRYQL